MRTWSLWRIVHVLKELAEYARRSRVLVSRDELEHRAECLERDAPPTHDLEPFLCKAVDNVLLSHADGVHLAASKRTSKHSDTARRAAFKHLLGTLAQRYVSVGQPTWPTVFKVAAVTCAAGTQRDRFKSHDRIDAAALGAGSRNGFHCRGACGARGR